MLQKLGRQRLAGVAMVTIGLAAGLAAVQPSAAPAAPSQSAAERTQVMQALSVCRRVADPAERVACYDKAVDALDVAEKKGDVVVVSREHVQEARKQAFGFNLPSLDVLIKGPAKGEAVDQLTLDLARAHRGADGRWVLVAVDGAVWRMTDDQDMADDPHQGSKLLVTRGAFGAFFCRVDGQPSVRCVRVS
jgi:hypothetical protein